MNILLVNDNKTKAEEIAQKLIFLRKSDEVLLSYYKDALNEIKIHKTDIVLVLETEDNSLTLDFIKEIKEYNGLTVILITNSNNRDLILPAFDLGIDDFIKSDASEFELVLRIVHNIKLNSLKQKANQNQKLLEQLKVIDKIAGIYTYDYSKQVIENSLSKGLFMAIAPVVKEEFSVEDFIYTVKPLLRAGDIITYGKGLSFYLYMPETTLNEGIAVLNKIKEQIDFEICAGIEDAEGKSFTEIETNALKSLSNSIATKAPYIYSEDTNYKNQNDWLENSNKGYQIFHQMFNKKLEKVIVPTFEKLKNEYEEKLSGTKIEQSSSQKQFLFSLNNKKHSSYLKIIHSGFAKVTISVEHEGLDSPENREFELSLQHITEAELTEIIEKFMEEYKISLD